MCRTSRRPVDQKRTRAAMGRIASDVSPSQPESFPEEVHKEKPRLDLGAFLFALTVTVIDWPMLITSPGALIGALQSTLGNTRTMLRFTRRPTMVRLWVGSFGRQRRRLLDRGVVEPGALERRLAFSA